MHEAAVERADRQRRVQPAGPPSLEQLVEPLELALVVAQDQGRAGRRRAGSRSRLMSRSTGSGGKNPALQLAGALPAHQAEPRQRSQPSAHAAGASKSSSRVGHVLAQPPRDLEMMRRLAPGARRPLRRSAAGVS